MGKKKIDQIATEKYKIREQRLKRKK